MITEINSDLFKTDAKYILHGCNAKGKMGKGVALEIRHRYPQAYTSYLERHMKYGLILGEYYPVDCGEKIIINAITQSDYAKAYGDSKRYVSYDAIAEIFESLNNKYKGSIIAMPRIGSQLGGGNWNIIKDILKTTSSDLDLKIYYL